MSDDPFDLEGKNLRRVAPQIRRMIGLQRARVISYIVSTVVLSALGLIWATVGWIPAFLGNTGFALAPFATLGIFADFRLLTFQKQRLAECERRMARDSEPGGAAVGNDASRMP